MSHRWSPPLKIFRWSRRQTTALPVLRAPSGASAQPKQRAAQPLGHPGAEEDEAGCGKSLALLVGAVCFFYFSCLGRIKPIEMFLERIEITNYRR